MKNLILLLPLLITSFFLTNCNTLSGHIGSSKDIEESKKRKVFIHDYNVINKTTVNDSIQLFIDEIWLENKWRFPKSLNKTKIEDGYRLLIKLSEEFPNNYSYNWIMCIGEEIIVSTGSKKHLHLFYETIPSDSIKINIHELKESIYKMMPFEPKNEGKILGSFTLTKKTNQAY